MANRKVEIIAEIANAHQGNPDLAVQLARKALVAGADAVKFQVYFADELLVRAHPRYEHFHLQSFSPQTWEQVLTELTGRGRVYCDVFGQRALDVAAGVGIFGFKVHSSDLGNTRLLQALTGVSKRTLLAVGGSTAREIAQAVRCLSSGRQTGRPVLMHGYQSYPTAVEDSRLLRLSWLKDIFGSRCDIGYMDHVSGDDPFALTLPLVALSMGAAVLEKHITLDRAARGVDYYSSLNPDEFARFVEGVRRTEEAIGGSCEDFTHSEREYRRQVKKHWVTARPLQAGQVLTPHDCLMKRVAETTADTVELEKLAGRPMLHDCGNEEPLTRAHVQQTVWALVVARMQSTRFPGKALADVAGMPALQHLFARLQQARSVSKIVLCTTEEPEDDPLVQVAIQSGVNWYRGPTEDVLGRMLGCIGSSAVDVVLRVTGDDILVDPDYVDRAVAHHLSTNAEYSDLKALPSGTEVEVFDVSLLRTLWSLARDSGGTEYLTTYVVNHRDQFRTTSVPVDREHAHNWRLTLDTPEDYRVISLLVSAMQAQGKTLIYRLADIVQFFAEHPEVLSINTPVRQKQTPVEVCTDLEWKRLV